MPASKSLASSSVTLLPLTLASNTVLAAWAPLILVLTWKFEALRLSAARSSVNDKSMVRFVRLTDIPPLLMPGLTVSSVRLRLVELSLTLPAGSLWRTMTDFAPSPFRVSAVPLPSIQLLPPLVLYCHCAPCSRPETLI